MEENDICADNLKFNCNEELEFTVSTVSTDD